MRIVVQTHQRTNSRVFTRLTDFLNVRGGGALCRVPAAWPGAAPWFTPVLGSGCSTTKSQTTGVTGAVEQLRAVMLTEYIGRFLDGVSWSELGYKFLRHLVEDRLRYRIEDSPTPAELSNINDDDKIVSDLMLACVLLTRLYHRVKAATADAPVRSDHDDRACLTTASPLLLSDLGHDLIAPCQMLVDRIGDAGQQMVGLLSRGTPRDGARLLVSDTVQALLARLGGSLNPSNGKSIDLSLTDVRSLSEFAWLCLTNYRNQSIYPGWGDLLVDLSNYDMPPESSVGRPAFDSIGGAHQYVHDRYIELTRRAFQADAGDVTNPLMGSVAALLIAQAGQRAGVSLREAPLPVAFSTSFDLELEIELLRHGAAFVLAVPVHVNDPGQSRSYVCWIAATVRPTGEPSLTDLLEPNPTSWRLFDDTYVEAELRRHDPRLPIVIRLAGCPVIAPPRLRSSPRLKEQLAELLKPAIQAGIGTGPDADADFDSAVEQLTLLPAVVISEHDAVLHGALDMLPTAEQGSQTGGVPTRVATGSPGVHPRGARKPKEFERSWVLMGVQMRDSAVRQRIATLVSALRIMAPGDDPPNNVGPIGLAVNTSLTDLETDLLQWSGLDVVTGKGADARGLSEHLSHVAKHHVQQVGFNNLGCEL